MTHSPTPWSVSHDGESLPIIFGGNVRVANVRTDDTDAAHIVKCVNMFDEMLALIKKIDAHLINPNRLGDLIDEAEKLIEKAKVANDK